LLLEHNLLDSCQCIELHFLFIELHLLGSSSGIGFIYIKLTFLHIVLVLHGFFLVPTFPLIQLLVWVSFSAYQSFNLPTKRSTKASHFMSAFVALWPHSRHTRMLVLAQGWETSRSITIASLALFLWTNAFL
jgi:hypothetical protein